MKKIWHIRSMCGNIDFKTSKQEVANKYIKRKEKADGTIYGDRWPLMINEVKAK